VLLFTKFVFGDSRPGVVCHEPLHVITGFDDILVIGKWQAIVVCC
jgi:hypothetical protein